MVFTYFKDGTDAVVLEKQFRKVKFFAKVNGIIIDCFIMGKGDHICWASDNRKETSFLKRIKDKDTVIVPEAICLGNGFSEVLTVMAKILRRKASLFCLKEEYSFINTQSNLVKAEAFLEAVQIGKDIKRNGSKKGIAMMRKSGMTIGHPLGVGRVHNMPAEDMDLLLNSDISMRDIVVKKLGISLSSYYTYRREHRKEAENQ